MAVFFYEKQHIPRIDANILNIFENDVAVSHPQVGHFLVLGNVAEREEQNRLAKLEKLQSACFQAILIGVKCPRPTNLTSMTDALSDDMSCDDSVETGRTQSV